MNNVHTEALLDRVTIYGFRVISIENMESLEQRRILEIHENSPKSIILETGEFFNRIRIQKTNEFDSFSYGVGPTGQPYGLLELSIQNDGFFNLHCMTIMKLMERLNQIEGFLIDKYGIEVDFSEAKFRTLEINKTFVVDGEYSGYTRVLSMMMDVLPKTLRLKGLAEYENADTKQVETLIRQSKNFAVKIYDKTADLNAKYQLDIEEHYLRYEITFKNTTRIKAAFGMNTIREITSEQINTYFNQFINNNVRRNFETLTENRHKEIKKIMQDYHEKGSRTWIHSVLLRLDEVEKTERQALLLDVWEIKALLDSVTFSSKQCKNNAWNTFYRISESVAHSFNSHDDEKYEEVISKLM